jgi:hypothetical protein
MSLFKTVSITPISRALDSMWGISVFPGVVTLQFVLTFIRKYFDKTQNIIFKIAEFHVG